MLFELTLSNRAWNKSRYLDSSIRWQITPVQETRSGFLSRPRANGSLYILCPTLSFPTRRDPIQT